MMEMFAFLFLVILYWVLTYIILKVLSMAKDQDDLDQWYIQDERKRKIEDHE
jgi:hypothetical protein